LRRNPEGAGEYPVERRQGEGRMAAAPEWPPETQTAGFLDPPRRKPPTAVGAATPEPPPAPQRVPRQLRRARRGRLLERALRRLGRGVDGVVNRAHA